MQILLAAGLRGELLGDMSQDMSHATDLDTQALPAVVSLRESAPYHVLILDPAGNRRSVRVLDKLVIGRDAASDVVVDDVARARRHAQLTLQLGGALVVTDLKSRNGTQKNGESIRETSTLANQDIIRIGGTFAIVFASDAADVQNSEPLIGGPSLEDARRIVRLVAPTTLPMLITGETGTGKEVVAQWIHAASGRAPMVAVNCGALPASLVESELFGHAKGAFTGAAGSAGLIASAHGGTLFLDEIGELPLPAQAALLRVIEDQTVRPVGSTRSHNVDVRIITATNRDLEKEVDAGRFRADLLARLGAVCVRLPPLRERKEDLPLLIDYLAARAGGALTLKPGAWDRILHHHWPRNVREVDHIVRGLMVHQRAIEAADVAALLPARPVPPPADSTTPLPRTSAQLGATELSAALTAERGNVRRAAARLGIARSHMYRLLAKHNLDPDAARAGDLGTTVATPGQG